MRTHQRNSFFLKGKHAIKIMHVAEMTDNHLEKKSHIKIPYNGKDVDGFFAYKRDHVRQIYCEILGKYRKSRTAYRAFTWCTNRLLNITFLLETNWSGYAFFRFSSVQLTHNQSPQTQATITMDKPLLASEQETGLLLNLLCDEEAGLSKILLDLHYERQSQGYDLQTDTK